MEIIEGATHGLYKLRVSFDNYYTFSTGIIRFFTKQIATEGF